MIGLNHSKAVKRLVECVVWASLGLILIDNSVSSRPLAASKTIAQATGQTRIPAFFVNVTLTEKAQRRLQSSRETIVVLTDITGEPRQGASIKTNEIGTVSLVNKTIALPKAGQAKFNNLSIPTQKSNQLSSQDYLINVNVASGRKSSQDNILACDFFDGKISQIQPGVTLKCGLIGEYEPRSFNTSNRASGTNRSRPVNAVPALW